MATKINIRSPYYLKYSDTNLTRVQLKLYIYQGTETVDKGEVKYELGNDIIAGNDFVVFEVSQFVRDYFNFEFNGVNYTSNTQWVTVEAELFNGTTLITTQTDNYLAFDAYTDFQDGLNAQGSRTKLMTTSTVIVPEGEVSRIPIFSEDVVSVTNYRTVAGVTVSGTRWNEETRQWDVNEDYWADEATSTPDTVSETPTLSTGKIQYFEVDSSVGIVEILSSSDSDISVVQSVDTCLWGKRKITFINKHGAYQDLWFLGRKKESVSYSSSTYNSSKIDFAAMNYSSQSGQIKRNDVNSEKTVLLNTGWFVEDMNSAIEELLMTESCWLTEDGVTLPVIPLNETLEKKTRLADGLINYELGFKMAFTNNNTVI